MKRLMVTFASAMGGLRKGGLSTKSPLVLKTKGHDLNCHEHERNENRGNGEDEKTQEKIIKVTVVMFYFIFGGVSKLF